MTYKIPGLPEYCASTPSSDSMIQLLGCPLKHNSVAFTHDEANNLYRFYGLDKQKIKTDVDQLINQAQAQLDEATEAWNAGTPYWKGRRDSEGKELVDPSKIKLPVRHEVENFMFVGGSRNIMRHVETDGLRIMGAISKYLQPGEDPVKTVLLAMSEAGFDVVEGDWLWGEEVYDEEAWDSN
jgi:hypothetical protein